MKMVDEKEFRRLKDKEDSVLVDVREPYEYVEGHIPGAMNIPMGEVPRNLSFFEDMYDSGKEILIYCHSGIRSRNVAMWLDNQDVEVTDLSGGIMAWPFDLEK